MREIEILGDNRFDTFTKTRDGCRAIIVKDGMILLTHETNTGWWLLPGGGMEEGETPEACCIREVEEETGAIVRPVDRFLHVYEYYEEYRYGGYCFICEYVGQGQMEPTEAEIRRGIEPKWIPLQDAIDIFSKHQSYAETSEEQRGSYFREYTVLSEYMDYVESRKFKKVIFLDIDGVLNSNFWNNDNQKEISEGKYIDPEKVKLLSKLVQKTGASLVLHSGWRFWFDSDLKPARPEAEYLANLLKNEGMAIAGITPDLTTEEIRKTKKFSKVKADEILLWLKNHPDVEKWLVLDDLELHNEEIAKYQVMTDPECGLTEKDLEKACEILKGKNMGRKDILGNEIHSDCVGCAIVGGELQLPGGAVYDGESIILGADPEIPIPGFLVITSKRHIQSFSELTSEEMVEIGKTIATAERAIKDLKIAETITLVQEERSKHFHIWIFPEQQWMKGKIGLGLPYLREINAYARDNATEKDIEKVLHTVAEIKEYFAQAAGSASK